MTDISNAEHLALLTCYGVLDATTQRRVAKPLLEKCLQWGAQKGFERDTRIAPHLRDMGMLGFPQCRIQASVFEERIARKINQLTAEMRDIAGNPKLSPSSPQQVADYLYKKRGLAPVLTSDGDDWEEGDPYSVSREALLALEESGVPEDVQRFINLKIQHGSVSTIRNTNIKRVFRVIRDNKDCGPRPPHPSNPTELTWLRPNWRTDTTSSRAVSNPNTQNYTSRGWLNTRTLFRAPGWREDRTHPLGFLPDFTGNIEPHVFIVTDSAQIELRIYAGESGDEVYTNAFAEGLDAHTLNMAAMLHAGKPLGFIMDRYRELMAKLEAECKETKNVRTLMKIVGFRILYGSEWQGVHTSLLREVNKATGVRFFPGIQARRIKQAYDAFHGAHPELRKWWEVLDNHVMRHGYVENWAGRRLIYPHGSSDFNSWRNFPCQSGAADRLADSMCQIAEAIPYQSWSPYTGICTYVHDELTVCVPVSKAREAYHICEEAFRTDHRGIPLLGEPEINVRYAGKKIDLDQLPN